MSTFSSLSSSSSSSSASDDSYDEEYLAAMREWEESVEQLRTVFSIVLLPWLGKWAGRRLSHWAYNRYLLFGLGKAFFLGKITVAI